MPSHVFNLAAGIAGTTGATGGITNDIPESLSVDLLRDFSNGDAVDCDTNTLTNAPGNAVSRNDIDIIFRCFGGSAYIYLQDDSYSSGEFEQDLAIARADSGTTSFADKTGYVSSETYNRTDTSAVTLNQGGVEPETYRGPMKWGGTTIQSASGTPGTQWFVNDTVTVGNTVYTVHSFEEVFNDDEYYSLTQSIPPLLGYQNNTSPSVTISHMKVVWSGTTSNQSGQTVPIRTLNGSAVGTSGDTGWVSVSGQTNIYFSVIQQISYTGGSTGSGSHNTDGKLEFWIRASGYNDTKIKEIGINIRTLAETT